MHKLHKDLKFRRIGWHVLRHTFASYLAQKGISLKAIQELLGHSDIKTTMRYAHLSSRELRQAVDVLSFGQQVSNASDFLLNLPTSHKDGKSYFSPYIKQKTELLNSAFHNNSVSSKVEVSQTCFKVKLLEEVKNIVYK